MPPRQSRIRTFRSVICAVLVSSSGIGCNGAACANVRYRSGPERAALAPLGKLAGPVGPLPAWALTKARAKPGDLVRETNSDFYSWSPQVLTRHGNPVAVLASARMVLYPRLPATAWTS